VVFRPDRFLLAKYQMEVVFTGRYAASGERSSAVVLQQAG